MLFMMADGSYSFVGYFLNLFCLGLGCTKSYRFPQDDGNGFARVEEGI